MRADPIRLKKIDINPVFINSAIGFTAIDVPQYEADALVNFYNSGNGDNWADNTGWKTDPVVGNWTGITVEGGHVVEIDFNSEGNVSGNVKHLQNLTNSTYFNFKKTAVTGDIVVLQNLISLKFLDLYDTAVTGDIVVLQNLISLTNLDLFRTTVTGDIKHIQSLTSLESLDLGDTTITGDIAVLHNLTGLERLHLDNTTVTGDAFIVQFLPNLFGTNPWDGFRVDNTNVSSYTQGTIPTLTVNINISNLGLSQTEIDNFLVDMDNSGSTDCPINVSGNSAPSQTGLDAIASLEGKGCTITYDTV